MTTSLPRQHRRCTVYPWCTGHQSGEQYEHHGEVHVVQARAGRELRVALTAVGGEAPRVAVELRLAEGQPSLEVVELDPSEVLQLAATLRQLALESREHVDH